MNPDLEATPTKMFLDTRPVQYSRIKTEETRPAMSDGIHKKINEVRLRVAARTKNRKDAEMIGNIVEALYLNGPAAGGGARKYVREIISIASIFIPEEDLSIKVNYEEL